MLDPIYIIVIIAFTGPILGSAIGIMRRPTFGFVCSLLCFAAGVMLAISFLELIPESILLAGAPLAVTGLVFGALVMYGLDRAIPHIHPSLCSQEQGCNVHRSAIYLILGMFLHNFPEGMAIAGGAVSDARTAIAIALAIAIHNIPEGICTSASFFHATGRRLHAFLLSSSTALPVLIGYITAAHLFRNIPPTIVGAIIASTAGLMIYITVDELIPNSCAGNDHRTIATLIGGVVFVILIGM